MIIANVLKVAKISTPSLCMCRILKGMPNTILLIYAPYLCSKKYELSLKSNQLEFPIAIPSVHIKCKTRVYECMYIILYPLVIHPSNTFDGKNVGVRDRWINSLR